MKYIFLPFVAYAGLFLGLISIVAGAYLDHIATAHTDPTQRNDTDRANEVWCLTLTAMISLLWFCFAGLEARQLYLLRTSYIQDFWNWLDLASLILNALFVVQLNIDLVTQRAVVGAVWIRTVGAVCCFLLWIKMFYWMRLFRESSHFIVLISTTLYDIRVFVVMLLIIIVAFANLFFVINNNSKGLANPYLKPHTKSSIMNALLDMYLLGLGSFEMDGYDAGPNVYTVYISFILGTFLIIVVFLNMLIAIMGNTFGEVAAIKEQNALLEQASLMRDHLWLLNLNQIFKNQRHIAVLTPDISLASQNVDLPQELASMGGAIIKKLDTSHKNSALIQEAIESYNRQLQKSNLALLVQCKQILDATVETQTKTEEDALEAAADAEEEEEEE
jgi:hypothetical protein